MGTDVSNKNILKSPKHYIICFGIVTFCIFAFNVSLTPDFPKI